MSGSSCVYAVYLPNYVDWKYIIDHIDIKNLYELYYGIDSDADVITQTNCCFKNLKKYGKVDSSYNNTWDKDIVQILVQITIKLKYPVISWSFYSGSDQFSLIDLSFPGSFNGANKRYNLHSEFLQMMELFFKEQDEKGVIKVIQKLKIIYKLQQ